MPLPLPTSEPGDADRRSTLPPPPAGTPSRLPRPPGEPEACHRHPDRVGGRRCTRCGKPACPECLHKAAVGSNCTDCVKAARPDIKTRARYWSASKPAIVTSTLIAMNVVAFVGLGLLYGLGDMLAGSATEGHARFALFGELQFRGGGSVSLGDTGEWYRLITSGFLHYGIIHLGFNMYVLFMLGNMLEPQLGRIKFVSIYFASMLGGSAGAVLLEPNALTAGASGAVFGLLGAAAVGMWHQGINPFSTGIGRLLLINLAFTFFFRGTVSVGGHLGGVIAGAICAFVMMAPSYKSIPRWAGYGAPAVVAAVSVAATFIAVG